MTVESQRLAMGRNPGLVNRAKIIIEGLPASTKLYVVAIDFVWSTLAKALQRSCSQRTLLIKILTYSAGMTDKPFREIGEWLSI